jgi:hypothetical protein
MIAMFGTSLSSTKSPSNHKSLSNNNGKHDFKASIGRFSWFQQLAEPSASTKSQTRLQLQSHDDWYVFIHEN